MIDSTHTSGSGASAEEIDSLTEQVVPYVADSVPPRKRRDSVRTYLSKIAEPELVAVLAKISESSGLSPESLYDSIAPIFDRAFPDRSHGTRIHELLGDADRFRRGLDLGCGTGASTVPMLDKCDEVIGVDVSERMLEIARDRYESPSVRFVRASFLDRPPKDVTNCDLLTCIGVARHVPAGKEGVFFRFVRNVLVSGGIALISFISERRDPDVAILDNALEAWANAKGIPNRHFSEEELTRGFEEAGFHVVTIKREPSRYLYDKLLVRAHAI